jgi:hypothetical protein
MFNTPKQTLNGSPVSQVTPIIPDPWETAEAESKLRSPQDLNERLREPHPLINAAEEFLELEPEGRPGAALLPTHTNSSEFDPAEILLENELKLHSSFLETCKAQIEEALALLYWLATQPEQFAIR